MIEIIDDHGRFVKGSLHAVIIAHIGQSDLSGKRLQFLIEKHPISFIATPVDLVVKRNKVRMFLRYIIQNHVLVAAAQIEILQPDQITLILHAVDDCLDVCDPGEDRRDKAGGADTDFVELLHCNQPALDIDRLVHIILEALIKRVDTETHARIGISLYQVDIPQNQIGLCLDAQLYAASLQFFEQSARSAIGLLLRVIRIGNRAEEQFLALVLLRTFDRLPVFYVDEFAPRLGCPVNRFIKEA